MPCSHSEPLLRPLGLGEQLGRDILDCIIVVSLLIVLQHSSVGVPHLHAFVLLLHLIQVHVQSVFLGGRVSEVQEHLGVVAGGQALLLFELIVVEVGIEVGDLLLGDIATLHAVMEHNSSRRILVHSFLVLVLGFGSDGADSHGFLLRAGDAEK